MSQVSFPWCNGGEPFTLPDIPMAGDDECDRITTRYARVISLQKVNYLMYRVLNITAVKNLLDSGYEDKAYDAWRQALPMVEMTAQARKRCEWSREDFRSEFETYFQIEIEQKFRVKGVDGANAWLDAKMKDIEAESKAIEPMTQNDFNKDLLVTNLYWRLKGEFKTIVVDGQEVPTTKENLRQVIRLPTDWNSYLAASRRADDSISPEKEREMNLEEVSAEDIKKKSSKPLKSAS